MCYAGLLRCVVPRWVLQRDLEGVEGRVFKKPGRHVPALGAVSYPESEERMSRPVIALLGQCCFGPELVWCSPVAALLRCLRLGWG